MFGLIIAGRPVRTNFTQISLKQYIINIPSPETVNHIVVFLTNPLPVDVAEYGASVHFQWPGKEWLHLGNLTNQKPSAVFRLGSAKRSTFTTDEMYTSNIDAQIGISIEPINSLPPVHKEEKVLGLVDKIVDNLYNYVMSFEEFGQVPVKSIKDWYTNTRRKLEIDINYFQK